MQYVKFLFIFVCLQVSRRTYPKLKEVDDVLGGSEAWKNVDSTEGRVYVKYCNNVLYIV